jgi:cytochrome c-type biogenesis protein CcmH/NrfG
VDLLNQALRLDPTNAEGWRQLGLACAAMQHHTHAERHLRNALQLAGANPAVPYALLPLRFPPSAPAE